MSFSTRNFAQPWIYQGVELDDSVRMNNVGQEGDWVDSSLG